MIEEDLPDQLAHVRCSLVTGLVDHAEQLLLSFRLSQIQADSIPLSAVTVTESPDRIEVVISEVETTVAEEAADTDDSKTN